MKSPEFQALIEQLDELSETQRTALKAALRSKGSTNDALALIETQFAADPGCGHCGAKHFGTWGHANGLRRYKCKGCRRTFNALTGTPMAQLHKRDAWLAYARALVDRVSLRKAAKRVNVHLETSFRWRHRFLATARNKRPSLLSGIVEADETLILKSAKGSRKLVGRAPRKRGGKPKKTGTSPDDYDIVLIARDRHKATSDHILYDFEGGSFDAALAPLIERDAVLVTDGRQAYIGLARACGVDHVTVVARAGERVVNGFHIQNVNAYASRLKDWLRPFRGVASKYLASYLGWRRMIERDGDRLTPRHVIGQAATIQAATSNPNRASALYPVAFTNAANSPRVTGWRLIANGFSNRTRSDTSSSSRCASSSGEPIRNWPAGAMTISGHWGHEPPSFRRSRRHSSRSRLAEPRQQPARLARWH